MSRIVNLFMGASMVTTALVSTSVFAGVGLRAGYNYDFPTVKFNDVSAPGLSKNSGFHLGGTFEQSLGPVFVSVDALYAQRSLGFTILNVTASSKFKFVEVPVLVGIDFAMLRLFAGGYYSMGLGSVENCIDATCTTETYEDSGYEKSDFGYIAGVGISLPTPGIGITLDLRYKAGLKNFSALANTEAKWRSIDVVAGVVF